MYQSREFRKGLYYGDYNTICRGDLVLRDNLKVYIVYRQSHQSDVILYPVVINPDKSLFFGAILSEKSSEFRDNLIYTQMNCIRLIYRTDKRLPWDEYIPILSYDCEHSLASTIIKDLLFSSWLDTH